MTRLVGIPVNDGRSYKVARTALTTEFIVGVALVATSLVFSFVDEVIVKSIITKTGTNKSKKGEMFVNFFIAVYFSIMSFLLSSVFCSREFSKAPFDETKRMN